MSGKFLRTVLRQGKENNPSSLVDYVLHEYQKITENMEYSYSKKAYPCDNVCIKSFQVLIKGEWLNRFTIRDEQHAHIRVFEYLGTFYFVLNIDIGPPAC